MRIEEPIAEQLGEIKLHDRFGDKIIKSVDFSASFFFIPGVRSACNDIRFIHLLKSFE